MMHDNVDATIPAKAAMAGGTQLKGMSRFALGDIGNIGAKVSSLSLDPNKKTGAIKKEILAQQPMITRQKSLRRAVAAAGTTMPAPAVSTTNATTKLSMISTSVKASALKTEVYCDIKEVRLGCILYCELLINLFRKINKYLSF